MTDTEIIKALEQLLEVMLCEGDLQRSSTISRALNLIKRQQAEFEKKDRILESYALQYGTAVDKERIIKAEVEKLHPYKLHYGNLRMEIAREVCDRLKAESGYSASADADGEEIYGTRVYWVSEEHLDNLLKEMEKECEQKD